MDGVVQTVIQAIKDNIGGNKALMNECGNLANLMIDESVLGSLGVFAVIASMLSIPNVTNTRALAKDLKQLPRAELRVASKPVQKAVAKAQTVKRNVGPMSYANTYNVVARTIFAEARGDGETAMDAVASVIWNRAGGKPEKYISVISKKLHFSAWNAYTGGWTDDKFTYRIPADAIKGGSTVPEWDYSLKLAKKLMDGSFKSTIGNRNAYMNKEKASQKNVDSWGKDLDLKIGRQHFGYRREYDGFRTKNPVPPKPSTYVVKKGDTLGKIAKANNISLDALMKKNPSIKDANKIKIGDKIQV